MSVNKLINRNVIFKMNNQHVIDVKRRRFEIRDIDNIDIYPHRLSIVVAGKPPA